MKQILSQSFTQSTWIPSFSPTLTEPLLRVQARNVRYLLLGILLGALAGSMLSMLAGNLAALSLGTGTNETLRMALQGAGEGALGGLLMSIFIVLASL